MLPAIGFKEINNGNIYYLVAQSLSHLNIVRLTQYQIQQFIQHQAPVPLSNFLKQHETHLSPLVSVYPPSSPPPARICKPVMQQTAVAQTEFLTTLWEPFLGVLAQHKAQVIDKTTKGWDLATRMPGQHTWIQLESLCLHLTELWYGQGHGNISVVYDCFIECCNLAGLTMYTYESLQCQHSKDKLLLYIDQAFRSQAQTSFQQQTMQPYEQQGGLVNCPAIPINDLSPHHVLPRKDADQLLTLQYMKLIATKLIAYQQQISQQTTNLQQTQMPLLANVWLQQGAGIIEDWGQIPADIKLELYQQLKMCYERGRHQYSKTHQHSSMFAQFSQHQQHQPGRYFMHVTTTAGDQAWHNFLQTLGVLQGELAVLKRSKIQDLTLQRFLTYPWHRRFALKTVDDRGNVICLRNAGTLEQLRIRVNQQPYKALHGLGIGSSGLYEGLEHFGEPAYDWNIPIEDYYELSNLSTDLEKQWTELKLLNAHHSCCPLPGEHPHDSHQNAPFHCSIPDFHHTHLAQADRTVYPYLDRSPSRWHQAANGRVRYGIISLGTSADACALVCEAESMADPLAIETCIELQIQLLQAFGGQQQLNFETFLCSLPNSGMRLLLQPFSPLQRLADGHLYNPDTQQSATRPGVCLAHPSASPTSPPEPKSGKQLLSDYFDFAAKPGIFSHLQQFLSQYPANEQE